MKIAYLARVDIGKSSGVLKKITRQIEFWQESGHDVRLFALSRKASIVWNGLSTIEVEYFETSNYYDLFLQAKRAIAAIANWFPNLIYWRYSSYYLGLNSLVEQIPTVVEINTHYDNEYRKINKLGYLFHKLTYKTAFVNVNGFVVLTQELSDWLSCFHHPTLVLGDSVDFHSIPHLPAPNNFQPRLVCVASRPFPWIAVDKLLVMASYFPQWHFDIVGLEENVVQGMKIPDNVFFRGFLEGRKYFNLLQQADIAIGTLGLHRIGLEQMAPLKLREYLAIGLPSIIAYHDTDFPKGAPFLLQLPNTEENIVQNLDRLATYVYKWKGKRVTRNDIRHLETRNKERKRLEFIMENIIKHV